MVIGIDARPLEGSRPTGIGTYLINILNYFSINDNEDTFILYVNEPLEVDYPFLKNSNFVTKIVPAKIGTLCVRYKLPKLIKSDGVNVFWGTQHILPKRVKGIKYVLTVHDLALLINPKWGSFKNMIIQNIFTRKSIKQADEIISVSESTKKDITKMFNIEAKKIKRIYEGFETDTDNSNVDNHFLSNKFPKNYFLFISTIEPRKNLANTIKAFNRFKEKNNNDTHLIIAGGMGWKTKKIIAEYEQSPFKDFILLTGYIKKEEKKYLLNNCLGLVFVSNYEGFGIPALEAMQYGKPVILSNVSSLPEIGGDIALYSAPEDIDNITKNFEKVLNLTNEEKELIKEKSVKQASIFSWNVCASITLDTIKQG